jgi:hypothetical protein
MEFYARTCAYGILRSIECTGTIESDGTEGMDIPYPLKIDKEKK